MRSELLAPAGSVRALRAAFAAGADACYIGGDRFGARAYADNPSREDLCEAVCLAHRLGRKLYLTVNTLLKEAEVAGELYDWMLPFYRCGLDGVIVQDFGVAEFFRREFPGMELHASTQMAVTGPAGAGILKKKGFSRVVPARECSLEEIREIGRKTGLEIESFIHGAMCYSYSGQCLMSSLIGGRSGNRGRCAGICRLPFSLSREGRRLEGAGGDYLLSMKDMCSLDILPDLIEAGITSFKIEGRMKKPEYTAGVVSIYRKYIDLWKSDPGRWKVDPSDRKLLLDLFNRDGFHQGYYYQKNGSDMIAVRNQKSEGDRAGASARAYEVLHSIYTDREIAARLQAPVRGRLTLDAGNGEAALSVCLETERGEAAVSVSMEGVQPADKRPVEADRAGAQVRKTGNSPFVFRELEVDIKGRAFVPMQTLSELRRKSLEKLEDAVNRLWEREAPAVLSSGGNGSGPAEEDRESPVKDRALPIWIMVESVSQLPQPSLLDHEIGLELPLAELDRVAAGWRGERKLRLTLPWVCRRHTAGEVRERVLRLRESGELASVDGLIARNLEEVGILAELLEGKDRDKIILDAGLYTLNAMSALFFEELGVRRNTASLELNFRELKERDNRQSELVVYGRAPMMISAQCLNQTADACDHRGRQLVLTDRRKSDFPVQCYCRDCYNVIWNSLPTSLLEEARLTGLLGFASVRLHFTTESPRELTAVTRSFFGVFHQGERPEAIGAATRGHFRRGVE